MISQSNSYKACDSNVNDGHVRTQNEEDLQAGNCFQELLAIMARLRSAEGCPWDREQTHDSLKKYLIEECYETLEVIEDCQWEKLPGELGDVLLQVVFHAQIAKDQGTFSMQDVLEALNHKLVSRHPHVFGQSACLGTAEEVLDQWELSKLKTETNRESLMDGIPRDLPAMLRAYRMQTRAQRVGFDWNTVQEVLEKIREELTEVEQELEHSDTEKLQWEVGDLLFSVINLARYLNIDPENALQTTNKKFTERFRFMEQHLKAGGKSIQTSTLQEMDELWETAKKNLA